MRNSAHDSDVSRMYRRGPSTAPDFVDCWPDGVGWMPHPNEGGQRVSHAVRTNGKVWLIDPLNAPGVHERIAELGTVAGVLVCSSWHLRDSEEFAKKYGVPLHVPAGLPRVERLVSMSPDRVCGSIAEGRIQILYRQLVPGMGEGFLYFPHERTLYVPETLGTTPIHTVPGEPIGVHPFLRLIPPRQLLQLEPNQIRCGHGAGIETDATMALHDAIRHGRQRLPEVIIHSFPKAIRGMIAALR